MSDVRAILGLAAGLLLALGACRSTATDETTPGGRGTTVGTSGKPDVRPEARAGVCAPSSVARAGACPLRKVPAGTGSSPEGCKSDADCKGGIEGRCIGEHVTLETAPGPAERRGNLLAAPMPPPARSQCVYDRCREDKDCGTGARCECRPGTGRDRNECKPLDACLGDKDCSPDTLCTCGASGGANTCIPGNCRTDADCNGLACEPDSNGARFCRSPRDACGKAADCKVDAASYGMPICIFKPASHARGCDVLLPPPPG